MKKFALITLAMILCLSCLSAGAEVLQQVAQLPDCNWVYGTNLLYTRTDSGYALMDLNGNPVTDRMFHNSFDLNYGYITTAEATAEGYNVYGLIDQAGQVLLPFQYGDIDVMNEEWAVAFSLVEATADNYDYESWTDDSYWLIGTADVYKLPEGNCVASIARENFADAYAVGNTINIEDRATGKVTAYGADFAVLAEDIGRLYSEDYYTKPVNELRNDEYMFGLQDAQGNVIVEPVYDYLYLNGQYAEVELNDLNGLIDLQGNVIVPCEFEEVMYVYSGYVPYDPAEEVAFEAAGYVGVVKDGKLGYVAAGGAVTCEPKYAESNMDYNGASATFTDMEGNNWILAADGIETKLEGYERIDCLDHSSGLYYEVSDADYNSGLIDWHGNVVLPMEYDSVDMSGDGRYVLVEDWDNDCCYLYQLVEAEPAA